MAAGVVPVAVTVGGGEAAAVTVVGVAAGDDVAAAAAAVVVGTATGNSSGAVDGVEVGPVVTAAAWVDILRPVPGGIRWTVGFWPTTGAAVAAVGTGGAAAGLVAVPAFLPSGGRSPISGADGRVGSDGRSARRTGTAVSADRVAGSDSRRWRGTGSVIRRDAERSAGAGVGVGA